MLSCPSSLPLYVRPSRLNKAEAAVQYKTTMADLLHSLQSDPLIDDKGNRLEDEQCDASLRSLVKYMRSLKAQDVPQQVQGKPLVDASLTFHVYTGIQLTRSKQLLDPTRNTIGYLCVLLAYAQQAFLAQQVALIGNFVAHFDPVQARYLGPELSTLLTWLANYYEHSRNVSAIYNRPGQDTH
jgi:COP9 signalosome complex subunit 3